MVSLYNVPVWHEHYRESYNSTVFEIIFISDCKKFFYLSRLNTGTRDINSRFQAVFFNHKYQQIYCLNGYDAKSFFDSATKRYTTIK